MSENSIEFSLSNSEQRDSWLNSGHRTLDADTLTLTVERMKWYYDKKVQSIPFKVGNKVLLNLKDYQTMEQAL